MRKVGRNHSFSAGLLIGGKDNVTQEKQRIGRMNILVATPGRLLQHLDQTPDFDVSNLQMLVLDEADRILDCGKKEEEEAVFLIKRDMKKIWIHIEILLFYLLSRFLRYSHRHS